MKKPIKLEPFTVHPQFNTKTSQMQTIKSYLPIFPGFYNTFFEPDETSQVEYWSEELDKDITYDDLDFDYDEYQDNIAVAACDYIESTAREFLSDSFTVDFEMVHSPKYYNFRNDSINCTFHYSPDDLNRMIYLAFSDINLAAEYLEGKFKSRSGFISYYGYYNLDQWKKEYLPKIQNDPVIFASILELAILAHTEEDECTLMENMYYYCADSAYLTATPKNHE